MPPRRCLHRGQHAQHFPSTSRKEGRRTTAQLHTFRVAALLTLIRNSLRLQIKSMMTVPTGPICKSPFQELDVKIFSSHRSGDKHILVKYHPGRFHILCLLDNNVLRTSSYYFHIKINLDPQTARRAPLVPEPQSRANSSRSGQPFAASDFRQRGKNHFQK